MKNYELTYLISPDLSEEELKSLNEKINTFIQEEGGILNTTAPCIKISLTNPIAKKNSAFLFNLDFQLSQEKLENLEKKLKSDDKILRYIVLTKKLSKKIPEMRPTISRGRRAVWSKTEQKTEQKKIIKPKPKVELKEIEKKLEEILGE